MIIKQVFISSVSENFEDRRRAAHDELKELGMEPILHEELPPRARSPHDVIFEIIQKCDAVIGVYGASYGSINSQTGLSPTEEEFWEARRLMKPIYIFIDRMESKTIHERQREFLRKVGDWDAGIVRNEFRSLSELKEKIKRALTGSDRSPRYQLLLDQIESRAPKEDYARVVSRNVPNLDGIWRKKGGERFEHSTTRRYLVFKKSQSRRVQEPDKLLAAVNGDNFSPQQLRRICVIPNEEQTEAQLLMKRWSVSRRTQPRQTFVIAVEDDPHGLMDTDFSNSANRNEPEDGLDHYLVHGEAIVISLSRGEVKLLANLSQLELEPHSQPRKSDHPTSTGPRHQKPLDFYRPLGAFGASQQSVGKEGFRDAEQRVRIPSRLVPTGPYIKRLRPKKGLPGSVSQDLRNIFDPILRELRELGSSLPSKDS